jgi:TatD DNase family protein
MLIDSHAHITSETIYPQIHEVMQRAKQRGVCKIVNICTDEITLNRGIELRQDHPWVYNAAATTPHDVEEEGELFPCVQKAILNNQLIAIGETGLDYFYEHSNRKCQQHFLRKIPSLGHLFTLTNYFHCRDAFDDLFAICDASYAGHKALVHCFTGGLEEAKGVLDRGWFLSISGIATFKKSHELREVIKYTPIDQDPCRDRFSVLGATVPKRQNE